MGHASTSRTTSKNPQTARRALAGGFDWSTIRAVRGGQRAGRVIRGNGPTTWQPLVISPPGRCGMRYSCAWIRPLRNGTLFESAGGMRSSRKLPRGFGVNRSRHRNACACSAALAAGWTYSAAADRASAAAHGAPPAGSTSGRSGPSDAGRAVGVGAPRVIVGRRQLAGTVHLVGDHQNLLIERERRQRPGSARHAAPSEAFALPIGAHVNARIRSRRAGSVTSILDCREPDDVMAR